jgi:hypothetical protein
VLTPEEAQVKLPVQTGQFYLDQEQSDHPMQKGVS